MRAVTVRVTIVVVVFFRLELRGHRGFGGGLAGFAVRLVRGVLAAAQAEGSGAAEAQQHQERERGGRAVPVVAEPVV